jgi:MscS family membrane protein
MGDAMLDNVIFNGNTVGDLLWCAAYLAITFAVAKVVPQIFSKILRRFAKHTKNRFDDIVLDAFEKPVFWIVLVWGIKQSAHSLNLPDTVSTLFRNVTTVTTLLFLAWAASNLITAVRKIYIDPRTEESENRFDDQIIPIIEKSLKGLLWSFAILVAFDNIGFDIVSLLTGLGIGGIALAMAAKDTLSNIFGSVTVFADRPFHVDDVVTIKGHTGTIVELGLRTCRMRTFDDTLVTIPNSVLVGGPIENLSLREARKANFTLGLVYETTTEELEAAVAAVKEILAGTEFIRDDFVVRFNAFGDSALEITVIYWVVPVSEYFGVVDRTNFAIKRAFDANNWSLAFPSTTVYQKQG